MPRAIRHSRPRPRAAAARAQSTPATRTELQPTPRRASARCAGHLFGLAVRLLGARVAFALLAFEAGPDVQQKALRGSLRTTRTLALLGPLAVRRKRLGARGRPRNLARKPRTSRGRGSVTVLYILTSQNP